MCCKIMAVEELAKPAGKWCPDCKIGEGCGRYETRPEPCRAFECAYAKGLMFDLEDARPDHSKVVMSFTTDGAIPVAYVDKGRPDAWREGAAGRWFDLMVKNLGRGIVVQGNKRLAVGRGWSKAELAKFQSGEGLH